MKRSKRIKMLKSRLDKLEIERRDIQVELSKLEREEVDEAVSRFWADYGLGEMKLVQGF